MTFVRNLWYVAAWSSELGTDAPIGRTIIGELVVLYRRRDGAVVALEDRCPHRQAPLSLGRVEGDDLRCMYHGLVFGADGGCKSIPGAATIPPNTNARTFPAAEKDGWIFVWMGDPARADRALLPDAFDIGSDAWVVRTDAIDYVADYQLINDNLTDLSHLDFVHETTLGRSSGAKWSEDSPKITTLANGLLIERWFINRPSMLDRVTPGDTWNTYRFLLPGLFIMSVESYPAGTAVACGLGPPPADTMPLVRRIDQQAVTPVDVDRSRYLFATGIDARFAGAGFLDGLFGIVNAAFAEDKRMIEAQQRVWDATPSDRQKAFIPQDKAPAIFRRLIKSRIAEEVSA